MVHPFSHAQILTFFALSFSLIFDMNLGITFRCFQFNPCKIIREILMLLNTDVLLPTRAAKARCLHFSLPLFWCIPPPTCISGLLALIFVVVVKHLEIFIIYLRMLDRILNITSLLGIMVEKLHKGPQWISILRMFLPAVYIFGFRNIFMSNVCSYLLLFGMDLMILFCSFSPLGCTGGTALADDV